MNEADVEKSTQLHFYLMYTAAGICTHESAMKNGEPVIVPEFFLKKHH